MFCSRSERVLWATANQFHNTKILWYLFPQLTVNKSTKWVAAHALLCFCMQARLQWKMPLGVWIWMLMTLWQSRLSLAVMLNQDYLVVLCMVGNAKTFHERNLYKYVMHYESEGLFQTYIFFTAAVIDSHKHAHNTHTHAHWVVLLQGLYKHVRINRKKRPWIY